MDKNHIIGYLGVSRGHMTRGQEDTPWRNESILYLDYGGTYITLYICQRKFLDFIPKKGGFCQKFLNFMLRRVNFTECKFYLSKIDF